MKTPFSVAGVRGLTGIIQRCVWCSYSKIFHFTPVLWFSAMASTNRRVHKLVLTGGPCGGKTTAQTWLCNMFENMGWKVFRVPEVATILFSGGISYSELNENQAETWHQNCLVVCDRGIMDPVAYMGPEVSERMFKKNNWNVTQLRDTRYNQVVHLVTAAIGAESFYTTKNNKTRTEGVEKARALDSKTVEAWVGHPCLDIIDNSTDFDGKVKKVVNAICTRLEIEIGDALSPQSRKLKFLVSKLPDAEMFPSYQEFNMTVDYLASTEGGSHSRLTRREQNGVHSYVYTISKPKRDDQMIRINELVDQTTYESLKTHVDRNRVPIYKTRRFFVYKGHYYQLDIYKDSPLSQCPPGLIILEIYTAKNVNELELPEFLPIEGEITTDKKYSMWNFSVVQMPPVKRPIT